MTPGVLGHQSKSASESSFDGGPMDIWPWEMRSYWPHPIDHAKLTKPDRAMVKTKAGDLTDEEKVTSAMIELATEMQGAR